MPEMYHRVFLAFLRYAAPAMAGILVLRCAVRLLSFRRQPEVWGYLADQAGRQFSVSHWENVIGRSRGCDVRLEFPTVSRNHAVLTRYDDGSWSVMNANSKGGISVNGHLGDVFVLSDGDTLELGGVELIFHTAQQAGVVGAWGAGRSAGDLLLLTVFQLCACGAFLLGGSDFGQAVIIGFGGLAILQWLLFAMYVAVGKAAFEVETLAFFLCTLGMAVIATVAPGETVKQLLAVLLGVVAFLLVLWSVRVLERAKRFRYVAAVAGMGLLIVTLLFGETYYGAKNWLVLGGVSLQPSELAKVCYVYVGASTMDRLVKKRNLILLIAYTVALCGLLALMNDFGTALVFFAAFLMIAYLRSGSLGTVALACTALLFAGVIGLQMAPHALRRFLTWRHIWEDPWGAGFQQTQALMCIASGGLFGLGVGQGKMKNLFAADSDMVFATVTEEWGLVMAALPVICIMVLAGSAFRSARYGRSSFYTIAACTASGILLVQTILNVLGTVDALPLTGVTFPLLSNGGSSMVGVWALLAFLKTADTRHGKRSKDE